MSELNELIAPPVMHKNPNEKCPFCPPTARKSYTTYPGSDNNSGHLEAIMEDPSCLLAKQDGARPQTGATDPDGWEVEQRKPSARKKDENRFYTFQAHHLISGKQAMEGEDIEDWIKASGKNDKDTGYSINYTKNGFWAPSMPKKYTGSWGPNKGVLDDDQRQTIAEKVMENFGAQIHIGPHNISDPNDPKGHKHTSYDKYLKGKLQEIHDRIDAWAPKCKCEPPPKKQATHHVHNILDNLSEHMKGQITRSHRRWIVFLSKYAMNYHIDNCSHSPRKKKK